MKRQLYPQVVKIKLHFINWWLGLLDSCNYCPLKLYISICLTIDKRKLILFFSYLKVIIQLKINHFNFDLCCLCVCLLIHCCSCLSKYSVSSNISVVSKLITSIGFPTTTDISLKANEGSDQWILFEALLYRDKETVGETY